MKIDKLTDFLSIMSAILIVFGITYNILLYNNFAIDITEYINLTESLMLFLPALPKVLLFLPFLLFAFDILNPASISSGKITDHNLYLSLFNGKLTNKAALRTSFIIILIIFLLFILSTLLNSRPIRIMGYAVTAFFIAIFLPLLLRLIHNSLDSKKLPKALPMAFYLGVLFLFAILISVDTKTSMILKAYKNPSVQLLYKDGKSLATDSLTRYIGKTDNFIFLYNKKSKTTSIIPLDDIKEYRYLNKY